MLARDERRRGEVVPLLELPDALPWVARVRALRDRPERVAGPHGVRPLRPRTVRAASHEPDGERGDTEQDQELAEHLFAWYANLCSMSRPEITPSQTSKRQR